MLTYHRIHIKPDRTLELMVIDTTNILFTVSLKDCSLNFDFRNEKKKKPPQEIFVIMCKIIM